MSSAYFLGRVLGPDAILCFGEEADDSSRRIKLLPPEAFFAAGADYDLVLNTDRLSVEAATAIVVAAATAGDRVSR